jgi:guanidinopropionase
MGIPTFMRQQYYPSFSKTVRPDIGLIGVPFDGGVTNRPGARHGPREVRNYSSMCRSIHDMYQASPYDLATVGDMGDVPIENVYDVKLAHEEIRQFFEKVAACDILPITAGGDHSVTLPIIQGLNQGWNKKEPLAVIHIDAHLDTQDFAWGSDVHHGAPFRKLVESGDIDPKKTIQIGIRGAQNNTQGMDFSKSNGFTILMMNDLEYLGIDHAIETALKVVKDTPTYLSFDIDVLDPSYAPGTGTPEAGGMSTREAFRLLRGLKGKVNFVGGDLVEVSPPFDHSGLTSIAGATMMYEQLCLMADCVKSNLKG